MQPKCLECQRMSSVTSITTPLNKIGVAQEQDLMATNLQQHLVVLFLLRFMEPSNTCDHQFLSPKTNLDLNHKFIKVKFKIQDVVFVLFHPFW